MMTLKNGSSDGLLELLACIKPSNLKASRFAGIKDLTIHLTVCVWFFPAGTILARSFSVVNQRRLWRDPSDSLGARFV
jgi:hypothetical protein